MRLLLENGFKRFEGASDQGIIRLTQAMGGGKTHNLIALGLLAKHPNFRDAVMGDIHATEKSLGEVRVIGFSGRESDTKFGIWGALAEQLGKHDFFNEYYSPLRAPGQNAWTNLLKGQPTLILLDELPPYFENARTQAIGNSDLSVATGTALANLFAAVAEDLPTVCLVLTDLTASYGQGSQAINQALDNLHQEATRHVMNLEPVRMNSDEFYHILRKRIFEKLPTEIEIKTVAQAYGKAMRQAKAMDTTSQSPEQFVAQVEESYPFHPGIRDLYARFKENQNFQQTRGLIRLMRVVVASIYNNPNTNPGLIAAHTLDLNDRDTLSEIRNINPTLENAIAHDIASQGASIAERIDHTTGNSSAEDIAKLLLVSSLSTAAGALRGLIPPEIVANLCEPGRDASTLKQTLTDFETDAWYLHRLGDGKLYFKDVQNINAKLNTLAKSFVPEQSIKELKVFLSRLFTPHNSWCYQDIAVLPAVDEIKLVQDRVMLVIANPHQEGLNPDLRALFENSSYRNRLAFLTGRKSFETLLDVARQYKAIQAIVSELQDDKVPDSDQQMQQARDLHDKLQSRMLMTVKETFTTLYYPNKNGLASVDFNMRYTGNDYHGEQQIVDALKAELKYEENITGDMFIKKIEARIFTQKSMPWADVKRRAASETGWQWHRVDALDKILADCLQKDIWREEGGFVEKGPFPKPAADLSIQLMKRDDDTGKATLRITPRNADTVYVEVGGDATSASKKWEGRDFVTDELQVSFLAVDSTGQHPTGSPKTWTNTITIKSLPRRVGNDILVNLVASPQAEIRYTTDGSNPKTHGGLFEGEFPVPQNTRMVLAIAERDGVVSEQHTRSIDWDKTAPAFTVDSRKPADWARQYQMGTTKETFEFLDRARKLDATIVGGALI